MEHMYSHMKTHLLEKNTSDKINPAYSTIGLQEQVSPS